jgi:hypothetical protein
MLTRNINGNAIQKVQSKQGGKRRNKLGVDNETAKKAG